MAPILFFIAFLVDFVTLVLHLKGISPQFVNVMSYVNLVALFALLGYVGTCNCSRDAKIGVVSILVVVGLFSIFFPFKIAMLFATVSIGTIVTLFLVIISMLWRTGHN